MPELTDHGTRYQHYTELADLLESAVVTLDSSPAFNNRESMQQKREELIITITYIRKYIDATAGFHPNDYKFRQYVNQALIRPVEPIREEEIPNV